MSKIQHGHGGTHNHGDGLTGPAISKLKQLNNEIKFANNLENFIPKSDESPSTGYSSGFHSYKDGLKSAHNHHT